MINKYFLEMKKCLGRETKHLQLQLEVLLSLIKTIAITRPDE